MFWYCQTCGHRISNEDVFCQFCGTRIHKSEAEAEQVGEADTQKTAEKLAENERKRKEEAALQEVNTLLKQHKRNPLVRVFQISSIVYALLSIDIIILSSVISLAVDIPMSLVALLSIILYQTPIVLNAFIILDSIVLRSQIKKLNFSSLLIYFKKTKADNIETPHLERAFVECWYEPVRKLANIKLVCEACIGVVVGTVLSIRFIQYMQNAGSTKAPSALGGMFAATGLTLIISLLIIILPLTLIQSKDQKQYMAKFMPSDEAADNR